MQRLLSAEPMTRCCTVQGPDAKVFGLTFEDYPHLTDSRNSRKLRIRSEESKGIVLIPLAAAMTMAKVSCRYSG